MQVAEKCEGPLMAMSSKWVMVLLVGCQGCRLQDIVTFSTTEAAFVALTEAAKEMTWFKRLLGVKIENYIVNCDSQSAIDLSKNAIYHFKTKHIELWYHFIRLALERGDLQVEKTHTNKNLANMLTKLVSAEKNQMCRKDPSMDKT